MKNVGLFLVAAGLLSATSISSANDFSTFTRVQYVTDCMTAHSNMNAYESGYKCSCVIDEIAEVFTQRQYEDLNAGYQFKNLPADRGATFRDDKELKSDWKLFETTLENAYKSCRLR